MKIKAFITPKWSGNSLTEIDVQFPIFRVHDVGGDTFNSVYYTAILSQDMEINLNWSDNWNSADQGWEIKTDKPSWRADEDYLFGRGEHALTPAEFFKKFDEAVEWIGARYQEALRVASLADTDRPV